MPASTETIPPPVFEVLEYSLACICGPFFSSPMRQASSGKRGVGLEQEA